MISVLIMLGIAGSLLIFAEVLWRKKHIKGETARKFVHIIVGVLLAFWPFFVNWSTVQIACFIAVGLIALMHLTKIFKSVYDINRRSWGDMIGPATVGLIALLEPNKSIFAAAILNLALADGLAALIGTKYGKGHRYKILKQVKSVVGTLTFFVISLFITAWVILFSHAGFSQTAWPVIIILPIMATILENFSPYGTDNFFIPLLVVGVLQALQFIY